MARALYGFTAPGLVQFGDPASQVLDIVARGDVVGWSPGFTWQTVAGMFPGWSTDEVNAAIDLAREQRAAGRAFGTPGAYTRPRLADIPVCPGCPAGKIEVRIRVGVFDANTGEPFRDKRGGPLEGVVACLYTSIPDAAALQDCVQSWTQNLIERFYPNAPAGVGVGEVMSAQRGLFFGR